MENNDGLRIGVLGGTFDPIHIGHLLCAEEALQQFDLDKVIFMVAGKPALKDFNSIASAQDRYWMCCLATADNPNFEVSTVEIDRVGTTYTIDTLRDLHAQLNDEDELFFIMGADALRDVPLWKDAHLIDDYAHFIVTARPGYDFAEAKALLAKRLPQFNYNLMEIPSLDISSSMIRERFNQGQGSRYLMTEEVEHYATERELYTWQ
ncbi:MAG: nicotinate-nucleotide adenylyltransferase [Coriobacteriia bacterium]|nr:nicotinate-nucleotide adenylyltransferase [Coriobacteriia bacterium]